jgi:hypothetical protein
MLQDEPGVELVSVAETRERLVTLARYAAVTRLAGDARRLAPIIRHPGELGENMSGVSAAQSIDFIGALIVAVLDDLMSPSEVDALRERAGNLVSLEASAAITSYLAERRTVD